jgi:hypothetical protein
MAGTKQIPRLALLAPFTFVQGEQDDDSGRIVVFGD